MKGNFLTSLGIVFCLFLIFGIGNSFAEVLVFPVISSNIQVQGGYLFWSDDSETPINKIPVTGGPVTPLAMKMGVPLDMTIHGQDIFWIDSRSGTSQSGCIGTGVMRVLNKTSLDGQVTTFLAEGDSCAGGTGQILVNETDIYWVNSFSSPNTYMIKKLPVSGGDATTLATSMTPIIDMKYDATHLFWLEESFPDRAAIKTIPLSGGDPMTLYSVPEFLSQSIPEFLIHDTEIILIHKGWPEASSILKIPTLGGTVTTLVDLPNTPRKIVISGEYLYWIDDSTIKRIPLSGGGVTTLASGLNHQPNRIRVEGV